jgi:hypothetical protein
VDFYAHEPHVIIEVDGPVHETQKEYDAMRQSFLESLGYRVLRFTNEQVLQDIQGVLAVIRVALEPHPLSPSPLAGKGTTPPRLWSRLPPPLRPRSRRSPPPRSRGGDRGVGSTTPTSTADAPINTPGSTRTACTPLATSPSSLPLPSTSSPRARRKTWQPTSPGPR